MKHKYLRKIGIKSFPDNHFGGPKGIKSFFSHISCSLKRKFTGIDPRDCWNLDVTFYQWLYERLQVFLKDAGRIVDLDYMDDYCSGFDYEGKKHSLKEMIVILSEKLKIMLTFDDTEGFPENTLQYETIKNEDDTYTRKCISPKEEEEEYTKKTCELMEKHGKYEEELRHQIFEIFEMILPCLWW